MTSETARRRSAGSSLRTREAPRRAAQRSRRLHRRRDRWPRPGGFGGRRARDRGVSDRCAHGPGPPPVASPDAGPIPVDPGRRWRGHVPAREQLHPWRRASSARTSTDGDVSLRRAVRERTVGSSGAASSAQSTRQVAGPGSSSVLSRAFWASGLRRWAAVIDGHAEATLHGRQRQVGDQPLDLRDADLLARPLGLHEMEVRVVAERDLATGRAALDRADAPGRPRGTAARPPGRGRASSCRRRAARAAGVRAAAARVRTARAMARRAWP